MGKHYVDVYNYSGKKAVVKNEDGVAVIDRGGKKKCTFKDGSTYRVELFNSYGNVIRRKGTFKYIGLDNRDNIDIRKNEVMCLFGREPDRDLVQVGTIHKLPKP